MKRRLALITAICMLLFSVSALAQAFTDMPAQDSTYYKAFEYAVNNKIINGSDGKVLPNNPITKAEAVTFISRAKPFKVEAADLSNVADVSKDAWYYLPVAQAVTANIISVDENNNLNPTEVLTRRAAWDMLYKVFDPTSSYIPVTDGEKAATRGDFILWLYEYIKPDTAQTSTQNPTEEATQAPTESETAYSEIKAQQAQEAMQVALGIRSDGTSYTKVTAYRDVSYTDWATSKTSYTGGSSSGGSSSGGSSSGGSTGGSDEDETQAPTDNETQSPTENETQTPTENETQEPTEEETAAPTEPPTYNGPIDNDKDNVIEDPFDDDWKPNTGGSSDGSSSGGSGSGSYDEEDEDFNINDADDPDYVPETEPSTEATEKEPSEDVTNATEEESSEDVTDTTKEESSEDVTDATEEESSEDATDATEEESSEDVTDATEEESSEDATDATEEEPSEEAGDITENEDESKNEEASSELLAWLFSKDWWFN